jgi:magnesium transporter
VSIESDPIQNLASLDPRTAARQLSALEDREIAATLASLHVGIAVEILEEFPSERREAIAAFVPGQQGRIWLRGHRFPEGTVARLVEPAPAVYGPDDRVDAVLESLRETVKRRMVIYVFVTEDDGRFVGVVAFRELVFARPDQTLAEIMLRDPFYLRPEQPVLKAMQEVVTRHFPVYPVCDGEGRLMGMVRGQELFEKQAFEISAQAGSMVGVEKEERLATPWAMSFRSRHPWMQINLLTVFVAGAVVGFFEQTIEQIVVLAMFLPVLAGQCNNLGAQALAVTLRGITLGEHRRFGMLPILGKEAWLGLLNGVITGLLAAVVMYVLALRQGGFDPLLLALATFGSMAGGCVLSGMIGALVPLLMHRLGSDPASASAIVLSTFTDVISMGSLLLLATVLLL